MRKCLIIYVLLIAAASLLLAQSIPFPGPGGVASAPVNAAFVSSAQAETASANTIGPTGLSIPSGDLIIVLTVATNAASNIVNPIDSNSDTPSCDTIVQDSNAIGTQLCVFKAGATVTSVTCSQGAHTSPLACVITWYTAGSLTGVKDQAASQAQNNIQNWSSGTTATLSGTNDLVAGGWATGGNATSTYTDGGTQRITCSSQYFCAIEDRNVSGTTAVAATGQWNSTNFGTAHGMAVK